jgi:hypothetical protein
MGVGAGRRDGPECGNNGARREAHGGAKPGQPGHVAGAVNKRRARSALSERAGPDTWPPRSSGKNRIGIGAKEAFPVEMNNVVSVFCDPDFGFP